MGEQDLLKRRVKGSKGRGVAEHCGYLKLDAGFGDSPERRGLPVCLLCLLPHDHVEAGAVLVTEDEAGVVIVRLGVHVEGPFKVHSVERRVPWRDPKQIREADRPREQPPGLHSTHVVRRPWTYPLPGRDRCSSSARSPCPAEKVKVQGHRRGWASSRQPGASGGTGECSASSDPHAQMVVSEQLSTLLGAPGAHILWGEKRLNRNNFARTVMKGLLNRLQLLMTVTCWVTLKNRSLSVPACCSFTARRTCGRRPAGESRSVALGSDCLGPHPSILSRSLPCSHEPSFPADGYTGA